MQTYRVWPAGVERKPRRVRQEEMQVAPQTRVEVGLDGTVRTLWTIPKTPPSLNQWQSMHWAQQKREKDAWERHVWGLMQTQGLPQSAEWVFAQAQLVFRKGAHRDLSNYDSTLWKIFPDVLQRVGVLLDDTEKEMRRGKVAMIVDKKLMGVYADPRLMGMTRLALIAKAR